MRLILLEYFLLFLLLRGLAGSKIELDIPGMNGGILVLDNLEVNGLWWQESETEIDEEFRNGGGVFFFLMRWEIFEDIICDVM